MQTVQKGYLFWDAWEDIEPYLSKAIATSNVEKIDQARVICLLQVHNQTGPGSLDHLAQRKFNQIIISTLYSPGDVILVEDDANKSRQELDKSQLADLDFSRFNFKGWDDLTREPEMTQEINDQQTKIEQAKNDRNMGQLRACLKTMQDIKTRHLYATWEKRQRSLQDNIKKYLDHPARKVFVQMGPKHGISDDPQHAPTASDFLPHFKASYVIFQFQANFISSLASSASGISLE